MLYQYTHTLLATESAAEDDATTGATFRVVPADGDLPDTHHRYALWTTIQTDSPVSGESKDKVEEHPTRRPAVRMVIETSADGIHWVTLDRHETDTHARTLQVPYVLPFMRARVRGHATKFVARAVLVSTGPFSLQPQSRRPARRRQP